MGNENNIKNALSQTVDFESVTIPDSGAVLKLEGKKYFKVIVSEVIDNPAENIVTVIEILNQNIISVNIQSSNSENPETRKRDIALSEDSILYLGNGFGSSVSLSVQYSENIEVLPTLVTPEEFSYSSYDVNSLKYNANVKIQNAQIGSSNASSITTNTLITNEIKFGSWTFSIINKNDNNFIKVSKIDNVTNKNTTPTE